MSYMLRDRPDGQVEIILTKPILIGVFPERDVASRICEMLREDAVEWPSEQPASFATAAADVAEMEREVLADLDAEDEGDVRLRRLVERARPAPPPAPVRNLPAVVEEKPQPPVFLTPTAPNLTEDQKDAAFRRIAEGAKIALVAAEFGLTMGQLRGMWANHKRMMQKHLAEGGQQKCSHCARMFTPSLTNPETCARCSHE